MASGMAAYEAGMAARKAALFALLDGAADVAEIGIGAAPNLRFYPRSVRRVTGVEPNEYMAPFAEAAAAAAGVQLALVSGRAEALPLEDASVDAVVGTLVLCSVRDAAAALAEVARVLRPGGVYLFVEHVGADAATAPALALAQRALDPAQQLLAGGCHLTRATGALIAARCGGSSAANEANLDASGAPKRLFSRLEAFESFSAPQGGLIAPHVAGCARA
jgi:SAM-dependent methyltransferase